MSTSSLQDLWEAATARPFEPTVSKDSQFFVGFSLLLIGKFCARYRSIETDKRVALVLTSLFGLNQSLTNVPALGVPASLAFGFGAVYMICAVGVYV
ncbi:MAG: hypothetical protein M1821_001359 [Bathelium mastoideum]|nr:MAG: hypothetical protein M1821_001359 [Bathelium mastoideum]